MSDQFPTALTLLPLLRGPLCSLSIPTLAFQSRCHRAIGQENNFGRAVMVQIFPSQIYVFGVFAYLFISRTISPRQSEYRNAY